MSPLATCENKRRERDTRQNISYARRSFCGSGWLVGGLGFGEKSPEAKAAEALHNFFTYVAVKIVASQLQVWPFPAANLTQREGGESTKQNGFRDKSLHHPIVAMCPKRGGKAQKTTLESVVLSFFVCALNMGLLLQDYNEEAYADLMKFLDTVSLKDGDKFCAALLRESARHKNLGKPNANNTLLPHTQNLCFVMHFAQTVHTWNSAIFCGGSKF
jgi:hypothetical protein